MASNYLGQVQIRYLEEILYYESEEAPEEVDEKNCGSIQGWVGQRFKQSGLQEGVPWNKIIF